MPPQFPLTRKHAHTHTHTHTHTRARARARARKNIQTHLHEMTHTFEECILQNGQENLCNLIGQLLCENFSLTCTRYRDSYRNCENDINDTPFVYASSQMRTLVSALYLIKLDASSAFIFQLERLAELIHVNLVRYVTVSLWNEFSPGAAPPHCRTVHRPAAVGCSAR